MIPHTDFDEKNSVILARFANFVYTVLKKEKIADILRNVTTVCLKVHKNENFFGFDFEFCTISMLVMHKK